MKYAFSPAGLRLLKTFGAPGSLLAFDFDGTLAPIANTPEEAVVRPGTFTLLEQLAAVAPTAAVTGRSLKNVRSLLPSEFVAWAGNHGAEMKPAGPAQRRLGLARRQVKLWAGDLQRDLRGLPGVWLEEKELSLCVHYRESPNRAAARRLALRAVAGLEPPPRALSGKCVVNLLFPGLPHKGQALQSLLRMFRLRRAVYVGDDENDEDVFALADPRVCSVRVGRSQVSRAALYLRRQTEIDRLLELLLELRAGAEMRYRSRQ